MKKEQIKRVFWAFAAISPFPVIAVITKIFFLNYYLPEWMLHNKHPAFEIWVILILSGMVVVTLIFLTKKLIKKGNIEERNE